MSFMFQNLLLPASFISYHLLFIPIMFHPYCLWYIKQTDLSILVQFDHSLEVDYNLPFNTMKNGRQSISGCEEILNIKTFDIFCIICSDIGCDLKANRNEFLSENLIKLKAILYTGKGQLMKHLAECGWGKVWPEIMSHIVREGSCREVC